MSCYPLLKGWPYPSNVTRRGTGTDSAEKGKEVGSRSWEMRERSENKPEISPTDRWKCCGNGKNKRRKKKRKRRRKSRKGKKRKRGKNKRRKKSKKRRGRTKGGGRGRD